MIYAWFLLQDMSMGLIETNEDLSSTMTGLLKVKKRFFLAEEKGRTLGFFISSIVALFSLVPSLRVIVRVISRYAARWQEFICQQHFSFFSYHNNHQCIASISVVSLFSTIDIERDRSDRSWSNYTIILESPVSAHFSSLSLCFLLLLFFFRLCLID